MGGEGAITFDENSLDDLIALTNQPSDFSKPNIIKDDTFTSHKLPANTLFDEVPLDALISVAQSQDAIPEVGIEFWSSRQWLFGESNYDLCLCKVRLVGAPTLYRLPEECSSVVASDAAGKEWVALATDSDGACALHAAFGAPGERAGELRSSPVCNVFPDGTILIVCVNFVFR